MRRVVSVVLLLGALVVTSLPTWQVRWMPPPDTDRSFVSLEPWFSPYLFGYGDPFPLLCMLCTAIALVLARAGSRAPALPPQSR